MPIFDFHCKNCDKVFEVFQKAASKTQATSQVTCTACGSDNLEKLVSAPAPPPQSLAIRKRFRAKAAAEGHLSNFSAKEIATFKS